MNGYGRGNYNKQDAYPDAGNEKYGRKKDNSPEKSYGHDLVPEGYPLSLRVVGDVLPKEPVGKQPCMQWTEPLC